MMSFPRCGLLPLLALAAAGATVAQPPPYLVADVATEPNLEFSYGFDAFYFAALEGRLYFVVDDGVHGRELWTSDGSEAGTRLVADVCPGFCSSHAAWLTVAGGRLYFVADDGAHGRELWTSDGTAAGSRLVADLVPGLGPSAPLWLTADDTGVYFVADDQVHGAELWKTDGTAAGTAMVADLNPGADGSAPDRLTLLPGGLFFAAEDGSQGREPWVSGGTAATTLPLGDLKSGPGSSLSPVPFPEPLLSSRDWARLGDRVVFTGGDDTHGYEPWVSDGTPGGTYLLADIVGSGNSSPHGFLEFAGRLYFTVRPTSIARELWSTDAMADTRRVSPVDGLLPLAVAGDRLFLRGSTPATGDELWKTDGTEMGTVPVADIFTGSGDGLDFFALYAIPSALGDDLFFFADDGTTGIEPWISDGTDAGTRRLRDVYPGPSGSTPYPFINGRAVPLAGRVYFWAFDGTRLQPWTTDGTEAGTRPLAPINQQRSATDVCFWFHCPQRPGAVDGRLFLRLNDGAVGAEPWVSVGTPGTTRLVADLETRVVAGLPYPSLPFSFSTAGTSAVFDAQTAADGDRLFAVRGNRLPNGAWVQTTVGPVGTVLDPQPATSAFGVALFNGYDVDAGFELWRSDGTDGATERVIDLNPGPDDSFPSELTLLGDEVFFTAIENATGGELYATDGSGPGTRQVADLVPGAGSSQPRSLTASGDRLFFSAQSATTGRELWVSGGTGANTTPVIDLRSGPGSALPSDIREVPIQHAVIAAGRSGGVDGVFFVADDGTDGQEVWWSDGSAAGTRSLGDLFPGPRGSEPRHLTSLGGRAFFVADDGTHGRELWTSDGTAAGTRIVADLVAGTGSSLPAWLTPVDGILYFTAHRPDVGVELWRTDGTEAATELVQDVFPGPSPSTPENLTVAGRRLFFTANDGTHGFELWAMLLPSRVPRLTLSADGDFFPGGRVTLTLLFHNPPPETLYDVTGDELSFAVPEGFEVLRVTADRGSVEWKLRNAGPRRTERTALPHPPFTLVEWNGSLAPGETLTLVVEAELTWEAAGRSYDLVARGSYDSDQDGRRDQDLTSDDPAAPGEEDRTQVAVAALGVSIPTVSEVGLVALVLLLAGAALLRLRRQAG